MSNQSSPAPADDPRSEGRTKRLCTACGQIDDHPKHIQYAVMTGTHPITGEQIVDDVSIDQHFDCCHTDATPCDSCRIQLKHAGDKRGLDLAEFLANPPTEMHEELYQVGVLTPTTEDR